MSSTEPQRLQLRTARDAANLFEAEFGGCECEILLVAFVDEMQRLLRLERELGFATNHVVIPIRVIVADAIRLRAAGVILGHCHPSGDPAPSAEDIAATRKLGELTAQLGLVLHDHLIFAAGEWRSLRALGLI